MQKHSSKSVNVFIPSCLHLTCRAVLWDPGTIAKQKKQNKAHKKHPPPPPPKKKAFMDIVIFNANEFSILVKNPARFSKVSYNRPQTPVLSTAYLVQRPGVPSRVSAGATSVVEDSISGRCLGEVHHRLVRDPLLHVYPVLLEGGPYGLDPVWVVV